MINESVLERQHGRSSHRRSLQQHSTRCWALGSYWGAIPPRDAWIPQVSAYWNRRQVLGSMRISHTNPSCVCVYRILNPSVYPHTGKVCGYFAGLSVPRRYQHTCAAVSADFWSKNCRSAPRRPLRGPRTHVSLL